MLTAADWDVPATGIQLNNPGAVSTVIEEIDVLLADARRGVWVCGPGLGVEAARAAVSAIRTTNAPRRPSRRYSAIPLAWRGRSKRSHRRHTPVIPLARDGGGVNETFTVRKVSFGVGVERTFPVHTPIVEKIELVTRGDVRRAKLYYLRDLRGKKAKIKELRDNA